jgi:membrane protease YdiL (CAAX protease family)
MRPERPSAIVGFSSNHPTQLFLFGLLFGVGYSYIVSLLGKWGGFAIYPLSPLISLSASMSSMLAFFSVGIAIPVIEVSIFRGVASPVLAERLGIVPCLIIIGPLFGLAHVLFGAGIFLFFIATLFSWVSSYIALRNQTLIASLPMHIGYNSIVMVLTLGLI